jgi:phosphoribosylglycinamide formyltransferase-1
MKNIAIFASGSGTNAQKIIDHFSGHATIKVALVLSNKATAHVIERARLAAVPTIVCNKEDFLDSVKILSALKERNIEWIVLAGFLLLIPSYLIQAFPQKIVNIHPALLPKHGGAGMYGMNVHEAVVREKDTLTGITIHYVDDRYDEGEIIFQAHCDVLENDTPQSVARKVLELEHAHFPLVIEALLKF